MPALTREEKLKLMRSINWDYNAAPEWGVRNYKPVRNPFLHRQPSVK